jgi:FkbM family methyltransferase
MATLSLIRIRFGSPSQIYQVKVPQWPEPVFVRGGNSSDTKVLYETLVTDEYDILAGLTPLRTIIDGGANIGITCLHFLHSHPEAKVIAVEPFADTFEVCRKNVTRYAGRVTAIHGAIWPHSGKISLDPQEQEWTNKVRALRDGEKGATEAVTMPSLIAAAGGSVDLLKLDVEGSEKEIFGPSAGEWLRFVRNIVIELHGPDCVERVFEALAPFDYESTHRDMVYCFRNLRVRTSSAA